MYDTVQCYVTDKTNDIIVECIVHFNNIMKYVIQYIQTQLGHNNKCIPYSAFQGVIEMHNMEC